MIDLPVKQLLIRPKKWLSDFLESRKFIKTTSNPLFTYHVSAVEFDDLFNIVRNHYPKSKISSSKINWCACFVLWCSEWYRREYKTEDGWSWKPIWDRLNKNELEHVEIADIVTYGLVNFWKRPLKEYHRGRNLLGSVFSEGGLPFQLISEDSNKFGNSIQNILNSYDKVELKLISIESIIKQNIEFWPKAFNSEDSIDLIASLIRNLIQLVNQFDLNKLYGNDKPSSILNEKHPQWRKQFPIPLENVSGAKLLDNWLYDAIKTVDSINKSQVKLTCSHELLLSGLTLYSNILLPDIIIFKYTKKQINTSRIDLAIFEGNKLVSNIGSSYTNFTEKGAEVRPRKKIRRINRKRSFKNLTIKAVDAGKHIDTLDIPQSSIQIGAVPLGFTEDDNCYKLIGQASFTTKEDGIFVLLPIGFTITELAGDIDLIEKFDSYNWYYLIGDFRFTHSGGDCYRIRTNSDKDISGIIELKGEEIEWESKPSLVYKGMPHSKIIDDIYNDVQLTDYINDTPLENLGDNDIYGVNSFLVKNKENDILLKRKIVVLPEDFEISFKSEKTSGHGSIIITTAHDCDLTLTGDRISTSKRIENNNTVFSIIADNLPPATVCLNVVLNQKENHVEITLPFPSSGIYAYDANNNPLNQSLSLECLLGAQLYLYSNSDIITQFTIKLALLPEDKRSPIYFWNTDVGKKPEIRDLYSFKDKINELFSLSHQLDVKVRLTISNEYGKNKHFDIRRYNQTITVEEGIVSLNTLEKNQNNYFKPMAMRIVEPERSCIYLEEKQSEGVKLDLCEIPHSMKKEEQWIILPSEKAKSKFRPKYYSGKPIVKDLKKEINSIQTAVKLFDPKLNNKVIKLYLNVMSNDITHVGWNYFKALWENYSYLPLSTFRVWEEVSKIPEALITMLVKFEMNSNLINRLDNEFPILWEFIPPSSWSNVIEKYTNNLNKIGISLDIQYSIKKKLLENLTNTLPYLQETLPTYILAEEAKKPSLEFMTLPLQGWKNSLLNDNSDNKWPDMLEGDFDKWTKQYSEILSIVNVSNPYQRPVIYYPIIAASIAAGKYQVCDLFDLKPETIFSLKQLRDFDPNWFVPVYTYFLNLFVSKY